MTTSIIMPVSGPVSDISTTSEETFGAGLLGPGFVIEPLGHQFISPTDGIITALFPSHHLIMMRTTNGLDLMIHIGFGSEAIRGDVLNAHVAPGDTVREGETLITYTGKEIEQGTNALTVFLVFPEKNRVTVTHMHEGRYDLSIT
ncbi:MAG: PTS glucose transporter subunit IIA [Acholeplasmataceae bacterium]|nr:PTS glucose transporter subunit IIA [Acholeplasmataceae bacterium]